MKYDDKTGHIVPDYYPMYRFNFPPEMSVEDPGFIVRRNISVQFANMLDNEFMTEIVNLARENGITDLFVLDKKFVLDALKEKLEEEKKPIVESKHKTLCDRCYSSGICKYSDDLNIFMHDVHNRFPFVTLDFKCEYFNDRKENM